MGHGSSSVTIVEYSSIGISTGSHDIGVSIASPMFCIVLVAASARSDQVNEHSYAELQLSGVLESCYFRFPCLILLHSLWRSQRKSFNEKARVTFFKASSQLQVDLNQRGWQIS